MQFIGIIENIRIPLTHKQCTLAEYNYFPIHPIMQPEQIRLIHIIQLYRAQNRDGPESFHKFLSRFIQIVCDVGYWSTEDGHEMKRFLMFCKLNAYGVRMSFFQEDGFVELTGPFRFDAGHIALKFSGVDGTALVNEKLCIGFRRVDSTKLKFQKVSMGRVLLETAVSLDERHQINLREYDQRWGQFTVQVDPKVGSYFYDERPQVVGGMGGGHEPERPIYAGAGYVGSYGSVQYTNKPQSGKSGMGGEVDTNIAQQNQQQGKQSKNITVSDDNSGVEIAQVMSVLKQPNQNVFQKNPVDDQFNIQFEDAVNQFFSNNNNVCQLVTDINEKIQSGNQIQVKQVECQGVSYPIRSSRAGNRNESSLSSGGETKLDASSIDNDFKTIQLRADTVQQSDILKQHFEKNDNDIDSEFMQMSEEIGKEDHNQMTNQVKFQSSLRQSQTNDQSKIQKQIQNPNQQQNLGDISCDHEQEWESQLQQNCDQQHENNEETVEQSSLRKCGSVEHIEMSKDNENRQALQQKDTKQQIVNSQVQNNANILGSQSIGIQQQSLQEQNIVQQNGKQISTLQKSDIVKNTQTSQNDSQNSQYLGKQDEKILETSQQQKTVQNTEQMKIQEKLQLQKDGKDFQIFSDNDNKFNANVKNNDQDQKDSTQYNKFNQIQKKELISSKYPNESDNQSEQFQRNQQYNNIQQIEQQNSQSNKEIILDKFDNQQAFSTILNVEHKQNTINNQQQSQFQQTQEYSKKITNKIDQDANQFSAIEQNHINQQQIQIQQQTENIKQQNNSGITCSNEIKEVINANSDNNQPNQAQMSISPINNEQYQQNNSHSDLQNGVQNNDIQQEKFANAAQHSVQNEQQGTYDENEDINANIPNNDDQQQNQLENDKQQENGQYDQTNFKKNAPPIKPKVKKIIPQETAELEARNQGRQQKSPFDQNQQQSINQNPKANNQSQNPAKSQQQTPKQKGPIQNQDSSDMQPIPRQKFAPNIAKPLKKSSSSSNVHQPSDENQVQNNNKIIQQSEQSKPKQPTYYQPKPKAYSEQNTIQQQQVQNPDRNPILQSNSNSKQITNGQQQQPSNTSGQKRNASCKPAPASRPLGCPKTAPCDETERANDNELNADEEQKNTLCVPRPKIQTWANEIDYSKKKKRAPRKSECAENVQDIMKQMVARARSQRLKLPELSRRDSAYIQGQLERVDYAEEELRQRRVQIELSEARQSVERELLRDKDKLQDGADIAVLGELSRFKMKAIKK